MKTIAIVLCVMMTGCSLIFEAEPEVPAKEPDTKTEMFCATVQGFDEDAGKWISVPYDCK